MKPYIKTGISIVCSIVLGSTLFSSSLTAAGVSQGNVVRPVVNVGSTVKSPTVHSTATESILKSANADSLINVNQPALGNEDVTSQVYLPDSKSISVNQAVYSLFRTPARGINPMLQDPDVVREDTAKRTANSKHYLLKNGSYRAVISSGTEHYLDAKGEYQDIVPALVDEADVNVADTRFSRESISDISSLAQQHQISLRSNRSIPKESSFYRALQVPFDAKLPKKFTQGYSFKMGSDQLQFTPVGANTVNASVYDAQTVLYKNAWQDVDATLAVTDTGIKETLVLQTPQAPNTFFFQVNGNLNGDLSTGNIQIHPAWLEDANGLIRDVTQELYKQGEKMYLKMTANVDQLAYPIVIDPTVTIQGAVQDFSVNTVQTTWTFSDTFYTASTFNFGDSPNTHHVAFLQFDLSQIKSNSIRSASLNLYVDNGDYYGTYPYNIYKVSVPWDQTKIHKVADIPPQSSDVLIGWSGPYGRDTHGILFPGWAKFDITSFVQQWVNGSPNYGVRIEGVIGADSKSVKTIASSEYSYNNQVELRPKLIVDYNLPPTNPTVITPNGGEVIDGPYSIVWSASADDGTTQNNLKYDLEYSINGGSTWTRIASNLIGQTSYPFDFSNISASSSALVRVRAYDGMMYGDWDTSNSYFTIRHNQAPYAPGNPGPGSTSSSLPAIVSLTPTLNWSFTDPDAGDTQSAFNVLIYDGSSLLYDSGWVASSSKSFTVPSGKLARGTTYSWKVQVKDSKGAVSPTSVPMYMKVNSLPVPTITSFTDGENLTYNILKFEWAVTDQDSQDQTHYQVVGSKDNWASWAYNSGEVASSTKNHSTPALSEGVWSFAVRVKDGLEWSDWSYRNNLKLPKNDEPNDDAASATPLQDNDSVLSLIGSPGDKDFFTFVAKTEGYYRITLSSPANLNYDAYVYDADLNLVGAGGQAANVTDTILFSAHESQPYYIKVVGADNQYHSSAQYGLRVMPVQSTSQTSYTYDSNGNIQSKRTTVSNGLSAQPLKFTTFDGTTKSMIDTSKANTNPGGKNTVEFWMNWDGTNSKMPFGWNAAYDLWIYNNFFGFNTAEASIVGFDATVLIGKWVHVAAVFYNGVPSPSTCELYINGKKQVLTQWPGQTTFSRSATTSAFVAGWGIDNNYNFTGSIGDVRIWNKGLSSYEIENSMYRVLLGDEPGLVYYQK